MKYMTDRKRVLGLGSGRSGTEHHWQMQVSSMAMVVLMPIFIFTFGIGLGGTYEEVLAYFSRPVPAIITLLTLVVAVLHFRGEAQEAIEDYVHGTAARILMAANTALAYTLIAAGLYALIKLAL